MSLEMKSGHVYNFRSRNNPGWCKKRTKLERYLIILSAIFLLFMIGLCIAIGVIVHKKHDDEPGVCATPTCIHTASYILNSIDESVDPCDDFYEFACGNYIKTTNLPEDKLQMDPTYELVDAIMLQLKALLDDTETSQSTIPKAYNIVRNIYKLCMNTTAIEEDSVPLVKRYFEDLGGWPLLEGVSWNANGFDWKRSMYKIGRLGYGNNYFLKLEIDIDNQNSSRRIINLQEAQLSLNREFLVAGFEDRVVKAYYRMLVDMAVLFGADKTDALIQLKETLEFEIEVAKITLPKEERRNSTMLYNPMSVKELTTRYPGIPWLEYMNEILNIPNIRINRNEIINVEVPQFIDDLTSLLWRTPKHIIANYIITRFATTTFPYLPNTFRELQIKMYKTLFGQGELPPRWKQCVDAASGTIGVLSGAAYVRKYFTREDKMHAQELVTDIRNQFEKILKNVEWMDEVTKRNALEKAAAMTTHIAYPDELLDDENLEEMIHNLDTSPNTYIEAIPSANVFYKNFHNKKLREPVNKTDWTTHVYTYVVNAFYSPSENSIEFPAGILQGKFFDVNRPRYMNYGSIGSTIGHEITHGFDDQGKQYDKDGNLKNWWGEDTEKTFLVKAKCIIDQYGNYDIFNLTLNGVGTQGENIADNGGTKVAYLAYKSWVARNGQEQKLSGLRYSPYQLFWISAAIQWCTKEKDESVKLKVATAVHSPNKFRVIGPLSNSEDFATDFNCPTGSNMNAVHKCQVW